MKSPPSGLYHRYERVCATAGCARVPLLAGVPEPPANQAPAIAEVLTPEAPVVGGHGFAG